MCVCVCQCVCMCVHAWVRARTHARVCVHVYFMDIMFWDASSNLFLVIIFELVYNYAFLGQNKTRVAE